MSGLTDAGGTVNIKTHGVAGRIHPVAAVKTHAHPHNNTVWPGIRHDGKLCHDGRSHGISGFLELNEGAVPPAPELPAIPRPDCRSEEPPMLMQRVCIPGVAKTLKELGGPLDVSREECDR